MAAQSDSEKLHKNLLKSKVGQESYKKIVKGWTTSRIKKIMTFPTTSDELRRMRNNILHAELTRRRNGRTRPGTKNPNSQTNKTESH